MQIHLGKFINIPERMLTFCAGKSSFVYYLYLFSLSAIFEFYICLSCLSLSCSRFIALSLCFFLVRSLSLSLFISVSFSVVFFLLVYKSFLSLFLSISPVFACLPLSFGLTLTIITKINVCAYLNTSFI